MRLAATIMQILELFKTKLRENKALENNDYKSDRANKEALYLSKLRL